MYLCFPVKISAVHNFTCLYGPTENVQNEATILTVGRKYYNYVWLCYDEMFLYVFFFFSQLALTCMCVPK